MKRNFNTIKIACIDGQKIINVKIDKLPKLPKSIARNAFVEKNEPIEIPDAENAFIENPDVENTLVEAPYISFKELIDKCLQNELSDEQLKIYAKRYQIEILEMYKSKVDIKDEKRLIKPLIDNIDSTVFKSESFKIFEVYNQQTYYPATDSYWLPKEATNAQCLRYYTPIGNLRLKYQINFVNYILRRLRRTEQFIYLTLTCDQNIRRQNQEYYYKLIADRKLDVNFFKLHPEGAKLATLIHYFNHKIPRIIVIGDMSYHLDNIIGIRFLDRVNLSKDEVEVDSYVNASIPPTFY